MTVQTALLCGCGSARLVRRGLCVRCARRARLSTEHFDGLREQVLERDGRQCQCCGELEPGRLVVHHRRPGLNRARWLVTICRACHARVHLMRRPRYSCSGLLYTLWREIHPRAALQTRLPLELPGGDPAEQTCLFPVVTGEVGLALELGDSRLEL